MPAYERQRIIRDMSSAAPASVIPTRAAADRDSGRVAPAASALALAREVLRIEAQALEALASRLDARFLDAVSLLLQCSGRVVVCGLGKSGHVGRKFAATLASTGTPALFVHAAEAAHGDLGMVTPDDVLVALSYSGESAELLTIVPAVKRDGTPMIAMTGAAGSSLARLADVHLDCRVEREACPLNLAPTSSTTAMLALGDALAIACMDARGFGPDDFARSHPGGALGRQLLLRVGDVMRTGDALPVVGPEASVLDALHVMSTRQLGMTAVVDADRQLAGIFTDGDLRRMLERGADVRATRIDSVMTRSPMTIAPSALAAEAARMLDRSRRSQLLVVDSDGRLIGALHTHDLMAAKVI